MNYKDIDKYYHIKISGTGSRIRLIHLRIARQRFPDKDIRLIALRYIYLKKKYGEIYDNRSPEEMFNMFTIESKIQYMLYVAAFGGLMSGQSFANYLGQKLPDFNTNNMDYQYYPIGDGINISTSYSSDEYDEAYIMLTTDNINAMTFMLSLDKITENNDIGLIIKFYNIKTGGEGRQSIILSDLSEPYDFSYPGITDWVDNLYDIFYDKSVEIYKINKINK